MSNVPIQVTDEGVLIPKAYLRNASEVEVVATADYFLIKPKQPATIGAPPQTTATQTLPVLKLPATGAQPTAPKPPSTPVAAPPVAQPVAVRRHPLLATGRPRNPKAAAEAANILENEADRRHFRLQAGKQKKEFDLDT
ncbi:MAG: hypothetical protein NT075_30925 [Chloroflexi bacterium]|nr:hypothetical protein [Chloroflexota bacterium]